MKLAIKYYVFNSIKINVIIRVKTRHSNLEINSFNEFDYSPYDCFNNTIEFAPGKFRIKNLDNKIPMVYSVAATRK